MKVKVLATVIAATFVMGAVGTADAGLFDCFSHKRSCCRPQKTRCCAPVARCAPRVTCCTPRPACCAPRAGCAPVGGSGGAAPSSDDVEDIPAPPKKDTEAPKPDTET